MLKNTDFTTILAVCDKPPDAPYARGVRMVTNSSAAVG